VRGAQVGFLVGGERGKPCRKGVTLSTFCINPGEKGRVGIERVETTWCSESRKKRVFPHGIARDSSWNRGDLTSPPRDVSQS